MSILQIFSALLLAGTALAVNGPCTSNNTPGVCISTASCTDSDGTYQSGLCPDDPTDIKCCIKPSCGSGGNCRFESQCSGSSQSGLCPGPTDFKCCIAGDGSGGGGGGSTTSDHDLSDNGVQFIAGFEGFRAEFYIDSAGIKTIGYGHACQPSSACNSISPPISKSTGDQLLKQDAARFIDCVNKDITIQLTPPQFDALVSFAFNLGCGSLKAIAPPLNALDFPTATERIKEYVHGGGRVLPGLVRRRQAEVDLFGS